MVRVTDASGLRAALERSGGTVTDFLELLVGERIEAHGRHHATIGAPASSPLQVETGRPLLQRTATLRGRPSGRAYVYAASVIVTSRLPAWFAPRLESSSDPIGGMLRQAGLDITRRELAEADNPVAAQVAVAECLLARTYRIDAGPTPLMVITEWFLPTLRPFLSGAAGTVDGHGRPVADDDPGERDS
jgi:chorismate-pyruvate lyase